MLGDDVREGVGGDVNREVGKEQEKGARVSATKENEQEKSEFGKSEPENETENFGEYEEIECRHPRFRQIHKQQLKDRLEFLKECRRCQHKRVFVVRTMYSHARVFVDQFYYDPPYARNAR